MKTEKGEKNSKWNETCGQRSGTTRKKKQDCLFYFKVLCSARLRAIPNTLIAAIIYFRLRQLLFMGFIKLFFKNLKEICELVESGFEYVCDYNSFKIFRKRN